MLEREGDCLTFVPLQQSMGGSWVSKDAELGVVHDKPDGPVTVQSAKDQNDEKLKSWSATRSVGKPNLYTDGLLGSIRLRIKNNLL
jgi:hypothetical protein